MANNDFIERNKLAQQEISYWKIISIVLSRWYWIAGTVILSFIAAKIYIAYTPQTFRTEASLKINFDDQNQAAVAIPTSYRYLRTNQIETEAEILRSRDVIHKAISNLDYKISYFLEGKIRKTEVYPNKPFEIHIVKLDETAFGRTEYDIQAVDNVSFKLKPTTESKWETFRYNQTIEKGNVQFKITSQIPSVGNYSFKFNSVSDFESRAVGGLSIVEADKNSSIMRVLHTDVNPRFSAAILNSIVEQYVINDELEKKRSAKQTIDFLDGRLNFIDSTVNKSGDILSAFQTQNNFIDPSSEKAINFSKIPEFEQKIADLELRALQINQLLKQVNENNNQTILSLNFGLENSASIQEILTQFNQNIQLRTELLKHFQPTSERVIAVERKIAQLKSGISNVIQSSKESNQQALRVARTELGQTKNTLSSIPPIQNDFTKLSNKSEIDQKMLAMLFERKLQAQISQASVVSSAKIISFAEIPGSPIDPIPNKIYTSYLFIGLLAGLGLIFLKRLLSPYIYDVETIEGLTATPIIGVILKYPHKVQENYKNILSLAKPKSIFAESVRSVRTNLSFMGGQKSTKIICVTSEISGEGKSFVTVNLAGTLAIIDKKVIVIAADLRRSKLHKTFNSDNQKGLSTYLAGQHSPEEIIGTDENHFIDFITSGPVPPNPSELLHSPMMKALIDSLKEKYEYIIIDTAPVGLVSDSIPLIRMADINLFVLRSGVSKLKAATIPDRLTKEYELNNIAIILNSFGNEKLHANIYSTNYAHGSTGSYYYSDYSGYENSGYYDTASRPKWWEFWKKK